MEPSCTFPKFVRLARARQDQGELSVARQLMELIILFPFCRVGPGFYQMAGFWKRGIPWSEKVGHLSPLAYRKALGKLNPMPYRKLSQNKLSEKAMFHLFRIPTPAYLGYYHALAGQDARGNRLCTLEDFDRFLGRMENRTRICFKPLEGWAGRGFEVAEMRSQQNETVLFRMRTRSLMALDRFKAEVLEKQHEGASIIEMYLNQHPVMASLNPSSVNTMRLWVRGEDSEKPRVILGYVRIGRKGSLVDNQSSGGIVAPIELESGVLRAAVDGLSRRKVYKRHPDHNALIEGERIPFFKESLALARRALNVFPGVGFAGADVAVSPSGPQMIEINLSPDREGAAFVGLPTKQLFGKAHMPSCT